MSARVADTCNLRTNRLTAARSRTAPGLERASLGRTADQATSSHEGAAPPPAAPTARYRSPRERRHPRQEADAGGRARRCSHAAPARRRRARRCETAQGHPNQRPGTPSRVRQNSSVPMFAQTPDAPRGGPWRQIHCPPFPTAARAPRAARSRWGTQRAAAAPSRRCCRHHCLLGRPPSLALTTRVHAPVARGGDVSTQVSNPTTRACYVCTARSPTTEHTAHPESTAAAGKQQQLASRGSSWQAEAAARKQRQQAAGSNVAHPHRAGAAITVGAPHRATVRPLVRPPARQP